MVHTAQNTVSHEHLFKKLAKSFSCYENVLDDEVKSDPGNAASKAQGEKCSAYFSKPWARYFTKQRIQNNSDENYQSEFDASLTYSEILDFKNLLTLFEVNPLSSPEIFYEKRHCCLPAAPIIEKAIELMKQWSWHHPRVSALAVQNELIRSLFDQLIPIMMPTFVLELNIARETDSLTGQTDEEKYESFIQQCSTLNFQQKLINDYPLLLRSVSICVDSWLMNNQCLLSRFKSDVDCLTRTFNIQGLLETVDSHQSDKHDGGKTVCILRFSDNKKIVYKPRSCAAEAEFQKLLSWVYSRQPAISHHQYEILERKQYAWCEFVESRACQSLESVSHYYQRVGSLMALMHALSATDFHFENIISHGEFPVVVDLEGIFHPHFSIKHPDRLDSELLNLHDYTVLHSGILPSRNMEVSNNAGVDISALGAKPGQISTVKTAVLKDVGTIHMRIEDEYREVNCQSIEPTCENRKQSVTHYVDDIVKGFQLTYQFLLGVKHELLADDGPIQAFENVETRVILRATHQYARLVHIVNHPQLLTSSKNKDKILAKLALGKQDFPALTHFIALEQEAIWNGDIPTFKTTPASKDLWCKDSHVVENILCHSGMERVRKIISNLSFKDLNLQSWVISSSLKTIHPYANATTKLQQAKHSKRSFDIGQVIKDIHSRIIQIGMESEHSIAWLGIENHKSDWILKPLDYDLYNGTSGIALYLAYYAKNLGTKEDIQTAYKALSHARAQIESSELLSIGLYSGISGYIYTLVHFSRLFNDENLKSEALYFAELAAAKIESDTCFDVIDGCAGFILALSTLAEISDHPIITTYISDAAVHLVQHAQVSDEQLSWASSAQHSAMSGISHGGSGIALALQKAFEISQNEVFQVAAEKALNFDNSLYREQSLGWQTRCDHLDHGAVSSSPMLTWCHGAPGVLIARAKMLEAIKSSNHTKKAVERDIRRATEITKSFGMISGHSICHGKLGNLCALLHSKDLMPNDTRAKSMKRFIEDEMRESVLLGLDSGWSSGIPLNEDTPGLMTGLAGIGYALMRLTNPTNVPCFLGVESPY